MFVGDTCLIRYISSETARDCFKNQDVAFVGDSTVEEFYLDFVLHLYYPNSALDESDKLPQTWYLSWLASKSCPKGHAAPRLSLWDLTDINTTITFNWLGHENLCDNLKGIQTLDDAYGRHRILSVLADPMAAKDVKLQPPEGPFTENPPPTTRTTNKLLTVVYGTALHDLYTLKSGAMTFDAYATKMGEAATLFSSCEHFQSSSCLNRSNG